MKKWLTVVFAMVFMSQAVHAGGNLKMDLLALSSVAVSGYYGVGLIGDARKGYALAEDEKDVLLYNETLKSTDWMRRYHSRKELKEASNIRFIYGLSLVMVSGTICYSWVKWRFSPRKNDFGLNLTIKF